MRVVCSFCVLRDEKNECQFFTGECNFINNYNTARAWNVILLLLVCSDCLIRFSHPIFSCFMFKGDLHLNVKAVFSWESWTHMYMYMTCVFVYYLIIIHPYFPLQMNQHPYSSSRLFLVVSYSVSWWVYTSWQWSR